jgi:hypothetical protein
VYDRVHPVDACAFTLIVAVTLFHTAVPVNDLPRRYLLPCLAPLLLFVVAGVEWLARSLWFGGWSPERRAVAVASLVFGAFFAFQFSLVRRQPTGFSRAAERLAGEPRSLVILVSGDPAREGMTVAEIAMRDVRPRHYVLRASKVLSQSDWFGKGYRLLFHTPEQVSSYLDSVPVDFVLVDSTAPSALVHNTLLSRALHGRSETWRRSEIPAGPLTMWERIHAIPHGEPNITINMKHTLPGTVSLGNSPGR